MRLGIGPRPSLPPILLDWLETAAVQRVARGAISIFSQVNWLRQQHTRAPLVHKGAHPPANTMHMLPFVTILLKPGLHECVGKPCPATRS